MLKNLKWVDPFLLALLSVVLTATLMPVRGEAANIAGLVADAAIMLLFFLHGAKLSREAIVSGMSNVKLHGATLSITYLLFPVLGLAVAQLPKVWPGFDVGLATGLLFLTLLPSTVQSSIAFTSMAGGNVPAAICAATLSNIVGIFLTPLLVSVLMSSQSTGQVAVSFEAIKSIVLQLLLPFILGHLARPWIGDWVGKHKLLVGRVDRSSILIVVYTAFSAAVVEGLWGRMTLTGFLSMGLVSALMLGFVLLFSRTLGRWLKLNREDGIVLLFCGSKKSLVSGVPMAGILFPAAMVGTIILPLMIFHQMQLIACAVIAGRFAKANAAKAQAA